LPTAKPIHENVDADRVGESFGPFKDVDFPIIDCLFRWNFEFGRPFETACFEECHDVVVVIRGDDEIQVGRESRFELTDRVPTNEDESDVGLFQFFECLDERLTAVFLTHFRQAPCDSSHLY
jgi:hypothetical protein